MIGAPKHKEKLIKVYIQMTYIISEFYDTLNILYYVVSDCEKRIFYTLHVHQQCVCVRSNVSGTAE